MEKNIMPLLDNEKIKGEYLNGLYGELADLIGIDAVLKLHSKYRGNQLFLPIELYSRDFIIERIVSEYNGYNVRELAAKYGYTEKWIRKILKDNT